MSSSLLRTRSHPRRLPTRPELGDGVSPSAGAAPPGGLLGLVIDLDQVVQTVEADPPVGSWVSCPAPGGEIDLGILDAIVNHLNQLLALFGSV